MSRRLHVWIVDDDASIRWVLERALQGGGLAPRSFESAEAALDALRGEVPDVLLTDIRMPGQSGLELLRKIRATRPRLPVIVMTAQSDLGNAVSAYEGGAFEYLPKPFDIDQVVDLVQRAAQGHGPANSATEPEAGVPELLGRAPAIGRRRDRTRLRRARAISEFAAPSACHRFRRGTTCRRPLVRSDHGARRRRR